MNSRASSFLEKLSYDGLSIELNADLKLFSTMRLRARGDLVTVKTLEALKYIVHTLNEEKLPYRVIGWGANALLPQQNESVYLKLAFEFDRTYLEQVQNLYELPASVSLSLLSSHATKFGLKGWEVFTGIPASLGGAIFMNAGTNLGEIGSLITRVDVVTPKGQSKSYPIKEADFSYRKNNFLQEGEVIYGAQLKHFGEDPKITQVIKDYLALRNRTQPLREFTCGCIFKNAAYGARSCRAGQHIDIMGLKGLRVGDVEVSAKHANFMVNRGQGIREDVQGLSELLQREMKLSFGVNFETEVEKF